MCNVLKIPFISTKHNYMYQAIRLGKILLNIHTITILGLLVIKF